MNHISGFIIDPHILLEHVYEVTNGSTNTIENLAKLHKLKTSKPEDGLVITSFDSVVHKFFASN